MKCAGSLTDERTEVTPLEQARALRATFKDAIQRLRPEAEGEQKHGTPDALQFEILSREYLLALPTRAISRRLGISESTLHRYRREATGHLARELEWQENCLARSQSRPTSGAISRAGEAGSSEKDPIPAVSPHVRLLPRRQATG
jgi:hypothetical protein